MSYLTDHAARYPSDHAAWCSLDIDTGETHPSKRRRVRHQHFWRNSDKLPPDHRLYVASADIKQALEEVLAASLFHL